MRNIVIWSSACTCNNTVSNAEVINIHGDGKMIIIADPERVRGGGVTPCFKMLIQAFGMDWGKPRTSQLACAVSRPRLELDYKGLCKLLAFQPQQISAAAWWSVLVSLSLNDIHHLKKLTSLVMWCSGGACLVHQWHKRQSRGCQRSGKISPFRVLNEMHASI
jgi:hypothetical protein